MRHGRSLCRMPLLTRSLWQLADEIELERAMRASEELAVEQASRVAAMHRI
jgi:hypothetical protein